MSTDKMIQNMPGATRLLVYSISEPGKMPDDMQQAVMDRDLQKMNLGVCLQTGGKTGFSKFWIVAVFYRAAD